MDGFFIEYRDPVFGLIILFSSIFVISFVNYWWGAYKSKEEKDGIEQFIKRFEITSDGNEYKTLLKDPSIPLESLALLARGYTKSGTYEKAIGLYLLALDRAKKREQKEYILGELGKTYFKAGFLRRSEEVFLEALKMYPRNEEALKFLSVTYEKLKEYEKAIEALDALEELGSKVTKQKDYLKALSIIYAYKLTDKQKLNELISMSKNAPYLQRKIFEFYKTISKKIDINLLDSFDSKQLLDLLWHGDVSELDLTSCSDSLIQEICIAKGLSNDINRKFEYFELEIIARLKKSGFDNTTLNFEYTCSECKNNFPIYFYRCPNCQAIASANIQPTITKESYEENISFL